MSRIVIAEYDAKENLLRLAEPLTGVKHGEKIRIWIDRLESDDTVTRPEMRDERERP
jgi:hypothetical protein